MFWIINDKIKFCPERNLLISLTRPDLNVILTTPASRCLNLLLESFPEVVTQKYFFDKVWGEDGMLVPANTLYQNISIIRRGLRTTGETDDTLVATVPRKGFQIEKNVRVTRVDTDCVDDGKKATSTGVETSPVETKDKPVENIPVMPGGRKKQRQLRQYIFPTALMIIAFCAGFFAFQYLLHDNPEKDFFRDYPITLTQNGCHFSSQNDDIRGVGNFRRFIKIILDTGLDCKKYPWVYFSSSSHAPALSVLACREPFEIKANAGCISLYFRGHL
ncbi:winged helix-turn-helix domain-containing protein [Enterobacter hormaechei subsp. xiangfangensis]|uniref:winged helix-turn-helix domain-containing protein n=1 Tax=Enterobacter hormaechei TaxID=158836 RepID=UPI003F41E43A